VADGRAGELYELDAVHAFERQIATAAGLDLGDAVGPWWNPPFYAWAFAPLSRLPFGTALAVWTLLNLACVGGAAATLARTVKRAGGTARLWGLVPLLLFTSCPLYLAITHGQNTGMSLLIVTVAALAWRQRKAILAGAAVALLAYKPQLAAVLGLVLVIDFGGRAFASAAAVGSALLLLNAITLPGTLTDYLYRLPANVHHLQVELPYLWERHVTLRAFWRMLLLGRDAGEAGPWVTALTVTSCAAVIGMVAVAVVRVRRATGEAATAARDQLVALTLLATPLLMPFYFDYDLLLLAVPATLYAINRHGTARSDGIVVSLWVSLALSLFLNPYVAAATRVNLATALLAAIAVTTAVPPWAIRLGIAEERDWLAAEGFRAAA
jgi:hypothetical protein